MMNHPTDKEFTMQIIVTALVSAAGAFALIVILGLK